MTKKVARHSKTIRATPPRREKLRMIVYYPRPLFDAVDGGKSVGQEVLVSLHATFMKERGTGENTGVEVANSLFSMHGKF
eukprot:scaffold14974_cov195-Amphora_coffeaeformis.AAC.9